ncbi:putative iron-sulfur cluster assembly accessory protein Isa2 [Emericellopsis cladophorae]|uniref:Iron-sulfur cluster assembly accessory protein Isa2 n=1 Tax=Emericellopsis cladophorae TaxID=2686198 RepID=A0A9P9XWX8_9HYPO|nr:putative iron-sulfur cluster assembly accessory protein Isa2 [Emericellopsis cladophorae]KAI6779153.1 putative iron-sulfur cluster assembly accessory protein Isa2 [Emericellopsis cladophorae]
MSPRGTTAQGAPTLRGCTFMAPMGIRYFSASPARKATVCVRNPLKDEDGNDMILEITPRAAKRLSTIMTKDANPDLGLRIQVESGGCHGFQYVMSLVTIPPPEDPKRTEVVREDDTIFQFAEDGTAPAPEAPRIILDEPSLDLLKGSKVDFTQELIGAQFKIVDNPLATSSCGCGTSFDIKA